MRLSLVWSRVPWILLGVSLPLFAVDLFRVPMPLGLKLPPPVIFSILICAGGLFGVLINGREVMKGVNDRYKVLFIFLVLLWAWHLLGMARAEEFQWAMVEMVKLTVGLMVFVLLLTFSSGTRDKVEASIVLCLWGSAFLMGFLIYKYAWVFHSPYLGISINEPTRANRNQLAWFLAVILPYAAAYFFRGPGRLRGLVPLLVMLLAWLYTSSRGSWICGSAGIAWAVGLSRGTGILRTVGRGAILVAVLVSVILFAWWKVLPSFEVEDFDLIKRVGSLVSSQEMASDYSYGIRMELVANSMANFERNPLVGSGLTNSRVAHRFVSHNDLLGIMSELGIIGLLFFAGIMAMILWISMNSIKGDWLKAGAQGSMVALTLYLGLINVYTTTAFWVVVFLALAVCELRKTDGGADV